ncbi:hypothetical protein, partial [Pseudomonas syringae group genomosp. 7]|uniref:hypothetical protein n=1 Tax=Pseudomonas syringae group genomosp. 7 TaxID=251699 RepID=UPI00376FA8E4
MGLVVWVLFGGCLLWGLGLGSVVVLLLGLLVWFGCWWWVLWVLGWWWFVLGGVVVLLCVFWFWCGCFLVGGCLGFVGWCWCGGCGGWFVVWWGLWGGVWGVRGVLVVGVLVVLWFVLF